MRAVRENLDYRRLMEGYPLEFESIVPRLRIIGLADRKPGVVTEVGDHSFHVRYDGTDSALRYPATDAHLFTAVMEPGNPRRPGAPVR